MAPVGLPDTRASRAIDHALTRIGAAVSWIWLFLIAIVTLNVVLRYAFGRGSILLEELQWHVYAVGFLLGLADGVVADSHVRIDVFAERLSPSTRAWVELYGIVLLLFPFLALVVVYGVPFVAQSFSVSEVSGAPGGLPARWAIKGVLLLGFGLLAAAAGARLLRVTSFLFGATRPRPGDEPPETAS